MSDPDPAKGTASDSSSAEGSVPPEGSQQWADGHALYEALIESLPAFAVCKDAEGRYVFVNSQFAQLLGVPKEELIGKTDFDLYPSDVAERYRREDRQVMRRGTLFEDVERSESSDGVRFMRVRKSPVRDKSGTTIGTQAFFWDATDQQTAANETSHEREMLRTLMNSLPDHIYLKDSQGRYVMVNEAVCQALGVTASDDVVGKINLDFISGDQARQELRDDNIVLALNEALIDREMRSVDREGKDLWFLTSKVPVRDAQGRVTGLVGIDRNITRLKRTEEKLRNAKRAADAANQAKGDFLANMSHEIRTPMNAIMGMTDLLLTTPLSEAQREYVTMVQQSGEALLTLINDILDFSKIEAGKLSLEPQPCDLVEHLGDTMKSLAIRAAEKNLPLVLQADLDIPERMRVDFGRLRQVIMNLVGNAIKFTDRGEVVLAIRWRPHDDGTATLQVAVEDTGIGISAEQRARIFREFEQADASTTRRFGGTGLGLAIAGQLVRLMGGELSVTSEPGKGSRFQFGLPMAPSDIVAPARPWQADVPPRHVYLFEPHGPTRRTLIAMIEHWGWSYECVDDLDELDDRFARDPLPAGIPVIVAAMMQGAATARPQWKTAWVARGRPAPKILWLTALPQSVAAAESPDDEAAPVSLLKPVKPTEFFQSLCQGSGIDAAPRPKPVSSGQRPATTEPTEPPNAGFAAAELAAAEMPLAGRRILLAEDNRINQKLAIGLLKKMGCRVTLAENGQAAIDACRATVFDAVLMDVQMPLIDGRAATRQIRQLPPPFDSQRIVAMTAHAMAGDRDRCLEAGMDDYLAKPIRLTELEQKLREVVAANANDDAPTVTSEASGEPRVDWEHARRAVLGDEALLREVVLAFAEDVPQLLDRAYEACHNDEAAELQRAVHSVKGSFVVSGCSLGSRPGGTVEVAAEGGQARDLQGALDQLGTMLRSIAIEVEAYLAAQGGR